MKTVKTIRDMTHNERVWELYKGFTIALFPELQSISDLTVSHVKSTLIMCYQEAERAVKVFEELSREMGERIRTDPPFVRRVPDFEVTAKEG